MENDVNTTKKVRTKNVIKESTHRLFADFNVSHLETVIFYSAVLTMRKMTFEKNKLRFYPYSIGD